MATTRTSRTHWEGSLFEGAGRVTLASSGLGTYDVSWPARAEEPNGMTSPEELIAAAPSSGFSMAFATQLTKAGYTVESVDTKAEVTFQPGTGITGSHLTTRASVPGISEEEFATIAESTRTGCPVSGALAAITITLDAALA